MTNIQLARRAHLYLQRHMRTTGGSELDAVTAGAILDKAGVLRDSQQRPGLPLRKLLRDGLIPGAYQIPARPYGRWHIPLLPV